MSRDPTRVTEVERAIARGAAHPRVEIWRLMRDHASQLQSERERTSREVASERGRFTALLVEVANLHHQLKGFVAAAAPRLEGAGLAEEAASLAALDGKLDQLTTNAGARMLRLEAEDYTPELEAWVEVIASVPEAGTQTPLVRDTVLPGVLIGTDVVQRAKVVLAVPEQSQPPDQGEQGTQETEAEGR
jgi:hypothetical protein